MITTVYNPVPHSPLATDAISQLNQVIVEGARHYHFQVVDVHKAFISNEPYWIEDYKSGILADLNVPFHRPIHPNNAGHRKIAELIRVQLEKNGHKTKNKTKSSKKSYPTSQGRPLPFR